MSFTSGRKIYRTRPDYDNNNNGSGKTYEKNVVTEIGLNE